MGTDPLGIYISLNNYTVEFSSGGEGGREDVRRAETRNNPSMVSPARSVLTSTVAGRSNSHVTQALRRPAPPPDLADWSLLSATTVSVSAEFFTLTTTSSARNSRPTCATVIV